MVGSRRQRKRQIWRGAEIREGCPGCWLELAVEFAQDLLHVPLDDLIVVLFDEVHAMLPLTGFGGLAILTDGVTQVGSERLDGIENLGPVAHRPLTELLPARQIVVDLHRPPRSVAGAAPTGSYDA